MSTGLTDRWQRSVMADEELVGWGTQALRGAAAGTARLYETGLGAYLSLEHIGVRRREVLPIPVVSIGNLTSGGTGKTPMTRLLCRCLLKSGKRPAILSRGHGGTGSGVRLVSDANGNLARTALDAGDEPLLLARSLPGVPVLVGKDRRQSGREAMRRFPLDVLVLDDGFQYWQLARDLDIVLIDARRPFDNGHCLPRGLLREPPQNIRRGDIIIATRAAGMTQADREDLRVRVRLLAPDTSLFFAEHRACGVVSLGDPERQWQPVDTLRGRRIVAWSAIARPDSFAEALMDVGAEVAHHIIRPDHAIPDAEDVSQARTVMADLGVDLLVMTEKDAVKWPEDAGDAAYLTVEMHVADEAQMMAKVWECLFSNRQSEHGG